MSKMPRFLLYFRSFEELNKYNTLGIHGTIPWVTNEEEQFNTLLHLLVARKADNEKTEIKTQCAELAVLAAMRDVMPLILPKRYYFDI
jgi:hypothetical protein